MALIKCTECGKEHSDSIAACSHCGFKRTKQVGAFGFVLVVVVGILMLASYVNHTPSQSASPPLTPEQTAQKEKKEAAFQKVVRVMKSIQAAARNPDSTKWDSIRANEDASVVCVEYRSQNGFGGMSKEFVVVSKNVVSQKIPDWNRHCTKPLEDIKYAVHAL